MSRKDSDDDEGPGSFDFLGFTHHWAKSRKGYWVVKQKTSTNREAIRAAPAGWRGRRPEGVARARSRFTRALKRIKEWCRSYRHRPVPEQHRTLSQKLRGHFGYRG